LLLFKMPTFRRGPMTFVKSRTGGWMHDSVMIDAYVLTVAGKPLERKSFAEPTPSDGQVLVEVEACGLCHTDLAYASGEVAPKHPLPLVLGHEIVGRVVRAGASCASLLGKRVLIPAVLPCEDCELCRAGRGNACLRQKMPGNDIDGGFATHVLVPGGPLVPLDDVPASVDVRHLSVVADAVSTAYQAILRSGLQKGDVAFVVGAGGVGGYVIQMARALGARVVALDVSAAKLETIAAHGAEKVVLVANRPPKEVRKEVHRLAGEWGVGSLRYRIFECSGTPPGQLLAYTLLAPAATMVQVGYCAATVEVRLSNLMAFDATIHGTWGCPPARYPEVLRMIYAGQVVLAPFVEFAPMSRVNEVLDDMAHHRLERRIVFDPRA
jgi:6-hydroxycyclohex-1-ene-1-carbonyl-CoA dehydrogenase